MRILGRVWVAPMEYMAASLLRLIARSWFLALPIATLYPAEPSGSASAGKDPSLPWKSYHLPRWLHLSLEERLRLETQTGNDFRPDHADLYLLNRLRFRAQVQPAVWLKFHLQASDARVWGMNTQPPPLSVADSLDIRQASAEFGEEGSRINLHLGRQPIHFGEGRLIADPAWGNVGRTFDAARMTIRGKGLKIDFFSASAVQVKQGKLNRSDSGNLIHGVYLATGRLASGSSVEPYFFWKKCPRTLQDIRTAGARWAGRLPTHIDFSLEAAFQNGTYAREQIAAWGWHSTFGYSLKAAGRDTRVFAEYNFASGDRTGGDSRRGTFDPLYSAAHDWFGLADQMAWSNMQNGQSGVEVQLHRLLKVKCAYNSLWLASARDGLYRGSQLLLKIPDGSAGRHVGEEIDLQAAISIHRQTRIATGTGRLFPAQFLKTANRNTPYTFLFLSIGRTF